MNIKQFKVMQAGYPEVSLDEIRRDEELTYTLRPGHEEKESSKLV